MSQNLEQQIRDLAEDTRQHWPVPGAAIRVVNSEGVVAAVDSGWADLDSRLQVSQETTFEIGSISKSFTAFALAQLAEKDLVNFEAHPRVYLPWLNIPSIYQDFTIRNLLQHSAGLITGSDGMPDALAHAVALRDSVTGCSPGEMFHYSNAGYVVLGLIAEAVSGLDLATLVSRGLLTPMGMAHSSAAVTHHDRSRLATGYQALHDDRLLLPGDEIIQATWFEVDAGDGNVASTATDMARYARMLIGRGTLEGRSIISRSWFDKMTSDLGPGGESSTNPSRYALGLNVEESGGNRWLTHGGGMVGYSTFLGVDTDAQAGVVVLTNAPGECPAAELLARHILQLAVGSQTQEIHFDRTVIDDPDLYVGEFGDSEMSLSVRRVGDRGLELESLGSSAQLFDTAQDRLGCAHPDWRQFPHSVIGEAPNRRWVYGPYSLAESGSAQSSDLTVHSDDPLVGHWRSFSPWYTSFRVVERSGRLHLIASAGVEAHTDEPVLVEISPGIYRIGEDQRLPERLLVGPVVDGRAAWLERDGCRYSRSFRP